MTSTFLFARTHVRAALALVTASLLGLSPLLQAAENRPPHRSPVTATA